jgi:tRNA nucleotidyltransferase (CCA-adding enzyme)
MAEIPHKVLELAGAICAAGGRALLVGGCVRDPLLGRQPKDWDLEVYGIEAGKLREILDQFGPVNVVGEAFTVYKIGPDIDVSIPRRERKSGRGHRAFVIAGDPSMTIEGAARRRDFTINAILQDPLSKEIIDPFRGRKISRTEFGAPFHLRPSLKTVCACCVPRSLPLGLSLGSSRRQRRSVNQ